IAIERVWAIQAAEVKIAPTVAVHVTRGHTGTIEENLIRQVSWLRQGVGKNNSSRRGVEQREARFLRLISPDIQRRPFESTHLFRGRPQGFSREGREDEPKNPKQDNSHGDDTVKETRPRAILVSWSGNEILNLRSPARV